MRMRFWKLALAAAACGLVGSQVAEAQSRMPSAPARSVVSTGTVRYYQPAPGEVPEPSAAPEAPTPPAAAPAAPAAPAPAGGCTDSCTTACGDSCTSTCDSCTSTCDSCCDSCGCDEGIFARLFSSELGDPFRLISIFDTDCGGNAFTDAGWDFGGHTQFAWQSAPDGAFAGNGPFLSQREWDIFGLAQQYGYLSKTADGSCGLDWGFRTDLMYGLDGNEGQAFGNIDPGHFDYLNGWDHGSYEWAMPQLYGELAYGDLSVKVGRFYTLIGYEVVPSTGNFFLSRQLTFYNSEPFTHTGALTTYKASDNLTVWNGWTLGMDTGFYQFDNGSSYLGGFSYTISDNASFIYTSTWGNLGWRGDGSINSAILSLSWTDKISSVHQFDVLGSNLDGADFAVNGVARDSIGFINYLFYQATPRVKAGFRQEWYKADSVSYNTYTAGINFWPHQNFVIRPEIRYMNAPGNQQIYTDAGGEWSDELFNQTVYGVDCILTF